MTSIRQRESYDIQCRYTNIYGWRCIYIWMQMMSIRQRESWIESRSIARCWLDANSIHMNWIYHRDEPRTHDSDFFFSKVMSPPSRPTQKYDLWMCHIAHVEVSDMNVPYCTCEHVSDLWTSLWSLWLVNKSLVHMHMSTSQRLVRDFRDLFTSQRHVSLWMSHVSLWMSHVSLWMSHVSLWMSHVGDDT